MSSLTPLMGATLNFTDNLWVWLMYGHLYGTMNVCENSAQVTLVDWNLEWIFLWMCLTGSFLSFLHIFVLFCPLKQNVCLLSLCSLSLYGSLCTNLLVVAILRMSWLMCTVFSKELPKNLLRFCIFFSFFYRCSAVKKHLPPLKFSLFINFFYCVFVTFNVLDHKLISILDKGLSRAGLWGQQQTESQLTQEQSKTDTRTTLTLFNTKCPHPFFIDDYIY